MARITICYFVFSVIFAFAQTAEGSSEVIFWPCHNRTGLFILGGVLCCQVRPILVSMTMPPNKSPEPTPVGACSSAVAVHVASRRWFSFFRQAQTMAKQLAFLLRRGVAATFQPVFATELEHRLAGNSSAFDCDEASQPPSRGSLLLSYNNSVRRPRWHGCCVPRQTCSLPLHTCSAAEQTQNGVSLVCSRVEQTCNVAFHVCCVIELI